MEIQKLEMTPVTMSAKSHVEVSPLEKYPTFGEYLSQSLKKVNQLELDSAELKKALVTGRLEDISQVVVAGQKAEIALQLTLQLRNRAVSAYQEMMRMQV